jgi:hypothetical protein
MEQFDGISKEERLECYIIPLITPVDPDEGRELGVYQPFPLFRGDDQPK